MDYQYLKQFLSEERQIVITTHKSPDGDAVGSSLALRSVLVAEGHNVSVVVPDQFPNYLKWMPGANSIMIYENQQAEVQELFNQCDLIFCLDYNTLERVGALKSEIEASDAKRVLIDHHLFPDKNFDFSLSDTSASSTAELIYEFVSGISFSDYLDKDFAECIYTGLVTDTGSFRFSSTRSNTHLVASELLKLGLEPAIVHQNIYDNNSLNALRLKGFALNEKLEVIANSKAAIIPLALKEKNRFKYQKGDTEGLVNYGLSIEGVEVAVLLSEEMGFVKFSFRSKGLIDVNEIARRSFNGGGHRNAAGGKLDCDINAAIRLVKTELEKIDYGS
jgi:phosphoesterase RecJ-like protein